MNHGDHAEYHCRDMARTRSVAKLIQTGEQVPHGTVDLKLVGGQWKIARVDPWLEF